METQLKTKTFDLEERTFKFSERVRSLLKATSKSQVFPSDREQLARSSGSVAANYSEANESISSKDFLLRIRICRKEAKESHLWLRLIKEQLDQEQASKFTPLIDESLQLVKIFNAIAHKLK